MKHHNGHVLFECRHSVHRSLHHYQLPSSKSCKNGRCEQSDTITNILQTTTHSEIIHIEACRLPVAPQWLRWCILLTRV